MCGRYAFWQTDEFKEFAKGKLKSYKPSYNIAPSQTVPIVTEDGVEVARWGLVPPWEKEFSTKYSTINARAENILDSRLYGRLDKNKRCLVPLNGFFEWKVTDHGKQPMFIKVKGRGTFYLAGLYDTWLDSKNKEHKSFTILTCEPNQFMAAIHNRMSVILERKEEKPWVEEKDNLDLKHILDPFPTSEMEAYPVSTLVNKPENNFPEVIERFKES